MLLGIQKQKAYDDKDSRPYCLDWFFCHTLTGGALMAHLVSDPLCFTACCPLCCSPPSCHTLQLSCHIIKALNAFIISFRFNLITSRKPCTGCAPWFWLHIVHVYVNVCVCACGQCHVTSQSIDQSRLYLHTVAGESQCGSYKQLH